MSVWLEASELVEASHCQLKLTPEGIDEIDGGGTFLLIYIQLNHLERLGVQEIVSPVQRGSFVIKGLELHMLLMSHCKPHSAW